VVSGISLYARAMLESGSLRVSGRGQMSLPAAARRRWKLDDGGPVGYLDLGELMVIVPGGVDVLRADLIGHIDPITWEHARSGFGDPELATE
jgi:hypothetical protein